jgi:hypothetical protein
MMAGFQPCQGRTSPIMRYSPWSQQPVYLTTQLTKQPSNLGAQQHISTRDKCMTLGEMPIPGPQGQGRLPLSMLHMLCTSPQSVPKHSAAPPPCEARLDWLSTIHKCSTIHTEHAGKARQNHSATTIAILQNHQPALQHPASAVWTHGMSSCTSTTQLGRQTQLYSTVLHTASTMDRTRNPNCTALYCMLPVQSTTSNSCTSLYCILPVQSTSYNSCHPQRTCLTRWITCNHCSKVTQESPLISRCSLPNFPTHRCQQQQRLNNPTQMALTVPCPCTAHAQLFKQLV